MSGLKDIFSQLKVKKIYKGSENTYDLIKEFIANEGEGIRDWVIAYFKKKPISKSNLKSENLRKEGNSHYVKGCWSKSLQLYTEALSVAENGTETHATALANRSAALYSMNEYDHCLRDISRCLSCNGVTDNLKYKVLIRRIQCQRKLDDAKAADETLGETLDFVEKCASFSDQYKEMCVNKLVQTKEISPLKSTVIKRSEIPELGENKDFPGASSLIGLRYKQEKGRHVVAEKLIHRGDVLFVEKAFIFAPIFTDLKLPTDRCHHCLRHCKSLIPCAHCSACLYCDDTCLEKSWAETHLWECKGMQTAFWNDLGAGFPAFRNFLKRLSSGNAEIDEGLGLKPIKNQMELARGLITNISKGRAITCLLITATTLIYYLKTQTNFLTWLSDHLKIEEERNLEVFLGSILMKDIMQFTSNSIVIKYWNMETKQECIPTQRKFIATALYPAVSMMNHSCKANITMYYIDNVIIVKALDNIKKGEEVTHCYGVDYRLKGREERQSELQDLFHFHCRCVICENPQLEIEHLNKYRCSNCSGTVDSRDGKCELCKTSIDVSKYTMLKAEAESLLENHVLKLPCIERSREIMKLIYNPHHRSFEKCYDNYLLYFFNTGDFEKVVKYFFKSLEIKEQHFGRYSIDVAMDILDFVSCLRGRYTNIDTNIRCKERLRALYNFLGEILPLHYPEECIDYEEVKALFGERDNKPPN